MSDLFNKNYDSKLKSEISIYQNYPELLPFIGNNWDNSPKILLIGESHYLPYDEIADYLDFDFLQNWYEGSSKDFKEGHRSYIYTRGNIEKVLNDKYEKPLSIYFNLKNAIKESLLNNSTLNDFAFYNYFQKPAFAEEIVNEDRSIRNEDIDNRVAFETLCKIVEIIGVKHIIFSSSKALSAFENAINEKSWKYDVSFNGVPHAGSQWWNRVSEKYNNNTGKERFIDILNEISNK